MAARMAGFTARTQIRTHADMHSDIRAENKTLKIMKSVLQLQQSGCTAGCFAARVPALRALQRGLRLQGAGLALLFNSKVQATEGLTHGRVLRLTLSFQLLMQFVQVLLLIVRRDIPIAAITNI